MRWWWCRQAWIGAPAPVVMGLSMLAWTKVPWPWPAVEWAAGLALAVLSIIAHRKTR